MSGRSFRSCGLYYLHDKLKPTVASTPATSKAKTASRVWMTTTRNCVNTDAASALTEMWRTAEARTWLKARSDIKRGGRACTRPVKTISLSWHEDDQPPPAHMIETADAFLSHMKWSAHQAVYVVHSDTAHRHIHIILNRVHPETGCTLDDYRERRRAQEWALAYELERDHVRCRRRAKLVIIRRNGRAGQEIPSHRQGRLLPSLRDRAGGTTRHPIHRRQQLVVFCKFSQFNHYAQMADYFS